MPARIPRTIENPVPHWVVVVTDSAETGDDHVVAVCGLFFPEECDAAIETTRDQCGPSDTLSFRFINIAYIGFRPITKPTTKEEES